MGDGLEAVQGQLPEGEVDQRVQRGRAVAPAPVPLVQEQRDLRRAVGEVLVEERDVADRGAVGQQDQEVVPLVVVALALQPLPQGGQGTRPIADLVHGHGVGAPALQQFGVVHVDDREPDAAAPPAHLPVRRLDAVLGPGCVLTVGHAWMLRAPHRPPPANFPSPGRVSRTPPPDRRATVTQPMKRCDTTGRGPRHGLPNVIHDAPATGCRSPRHHHEGELAWLCVRPRTAPGGRPPSPG